MQQIADWLQKLDLGQYAQRFAENEIDVSVLPHLTDQDLKDIGVPLGPRRKILAAITAETGTTNATPEPAASIEPKAQDTAERRQVTVMFSDLVGSTALSARMDPEDLREVITAYQKCVADTVQRFGGFVAKYMGDGVLVYFGYPQAHEDDAERAVRAGLDLVASVGALQTHAPLQTRVGIATGLVVVGDLIGSGASQEQAIVGETPNLSARLQGVAEPNSVVIAESTRRLVGNLFELQDLGGQDLKGIAAPMRASAVLRPSSVESRFDALHTSELTELVGREEELELLLRRWSKAKTGEGQVVLLSGEPGIGKSRLTAALLENLASEPHTRVRYFCSPQHTDSPFYPFIGQLERAAGFARDDTPIEKLDKLDALLLPLGSAFGSLFAELLSIPNDGRYPALYLTPQQRRQKTLDALTAQMEGLSRTNPMLMIFEDAHWADPTTLEALGRAVDRIPSLRILLLVTFRPEFQAPWAGRSYVTSLMLNRMTDREAGALIDRIVGNKPLAPNLRRDIIERTDGVPLFAEEMTKAVLEAGSEAAAAQAISLAPSPAVTVPPSLHATLMARLDRLGSAKEVAQIGAAIGREFSHSLLAAVARKPQGELDAALRRLTQSGLLFQQGHPPDASYLFKHALVQDAAYGTLLREHRRALHARIAKSIENQLPEIAENQPDLLARHCTEAGLIERAIALRSKAGQRSLEQSALVEAVVQFATARDLVGTLPPTSETRRQQIKLQVALLAPTTNSKGFAAPETKAAVGRAQVLIEEAEALGESLDDPLLLITVLYGFWQNNFFAFNSIILDEFSRRILALAEKQTVSTALMIGHRCMGVSLQATGKISAGRRHLDQAVALYNAAEHRPLVTRFPVDALVASLVSRALIFWMLGYPKAALSDVDRAINEGRETRQAVSLMGALFYAAFISTWCGEYAAARTLIDELLLIAKEKGTPFLTALGTMQLGVVLALTGDTAPAVTNLSAGIAQHRSMGSTYLTPYYLTLLAKAQAELGHYDDAWQLHFEATEAMEKGGEVQHEAEVYRVAGEIALRQPTADVEKAEAHFNRALDIARAQQAKSWELRASMSLARLWRDQGRVSEARELLAPVYGWFTEGFDTRDLKEAKALLEGLAA